MRWEVTEPGVLYGEAQIRKRRELGEGLGIRDDLFVTGRLAGYGNVPLVKDMDFVAAAAALFESVPVDSAAQRSNCRTGIQKDGLIGYLR